MSTEKSFFRGRNAPPAAPESIEGQIIQYFEQELDVLYRRLNDFGELRLDVAYTEPVKPRPGMLAYADGTQWNPNSSGEGLYVRDLSPAWYRLAAYSATIAAIAAITPADGTFIVGNGATWVAETGNTARTSLGLGTVDSPQFTAVNIGHATDTTLARSSAGNLSIEGNLIYRAGGANIAIADGGTNADTAAAAFTNLINLVTVDNTVPRFNSTAGLLQTSAIVIDDDNDLISVRGIASYTLTLADDTATSVSIPGAGQGVLVLINSSTSGNGRPRGSYWIRAGDPTCTNIGMVNTTNITFSTASSLSGTTGTDGNFTLATGTNTLTYFENRIGTSVTFQVLLIGA